MITSNAGARFGVGESLVNGHHGACGAASTTAELASPSPGRDVLPVASVASGTKPPPRGAHPAVDRSPDRDTRRSVHSPSRPFQVRVSRRESADSRVLSAIAGTYPQPSTDRLVRTARQHDANRDARPCSDTAASRSHPEVFAPARWTGERRRDQAVSVAEKPPSRSQKSRNVSLTHGATQRPNRVRWSPDFDRLRAGSC